MLISIDLDNTLLDLNKEIPESTVKYLNDLKNSGNIIVINSGRTIGSSLKVTNQAFFANYILGDTGSIIYDVEKKTIIEKSGIDLKTGEEIFNIAKDNCVNFSIFSLEYGYYRYFNEEPKYIENSCTRFFDFDYIINRNIDITHISFKPKYQNMVSNFVDLLNKEFDCINSFAMVDSGDTEKWIEIINKNSGKGKTLLRLAKKLGIERKDIISFGDAINDLEAIKESGIGVAMKNAISLLKEQADDITSYSNNEAGVEKYLRSLKNLLD